MKSEHTYLSLFAGVTVLVVAALAKLFQKYTYNTLSHLAETCSQSLNIFFTSGYHLIGLLIFMVVAGLGVYLSLKVIFSTLRIQRKHTHFVSPEMTSQSQRVKMLSLKRGFDLKHILVVKSKKHQAFTLGFLSQKIVITTGLIKILTEDELEAVIFHEQYHLKNYHSLLLLLGQLISSAFFFLPFLQDVFTHMRSEFEYQADSFARGMQDSEKHVISAITKLVSPNLNADFTPAFAVGTVENRLAKLEGKKIATFTFSLQKSLRTIPMIVILYCLFALPVNAHINETELISLGNTTCDQEMKCTVHCQESLNSSSIGLPQMSTNSSTNQ